MYCTLCFSKVLSVFSFIFCIFMKYGHLNLYKISIFSPRNFREMKRHKIIANNSKNNNSNKVKNMSYHSLSSCSVPASVISTFHVPSYLILTTILWNRNYCKLTATMEETQLEILERMSKIIQQGYSKTRIGTQVGLPPKSLLLTTPLYCLPSAK